MVFKKIREHKEYIQDAASWFQAKWDIPQEEYLKSMNESLLKETSIPQWYIMLENDNSIIGGIGVIENDFHNRKDLAPNVCAVYTEQEYRCQGIAGQLLDIAVKDMKSKGITPVYLITDHINFYEKYGWEFLCMVQGDNDPDMTRMYIHR